MREKKRNSTVNKEKKVDKGGEDLTFGIGKFIKNKSLLLMKIQ